MQLVSSKSATDTALHTRTPPGSIIINFVETSEIISGSPLRLCFLQGFQQISMYVHISYVASDSHDFLIVYHLLIMVVIIFPTDITLFDFGCCNTQH